MAPIWTDDCVLEFDDVAAKLASDVCAENAWALLERTQGKSIVDNLLRKGRWVLDTEHSVDIGNETIERKIRAVEYAAMEYLQFGSSVKAALLKTLKSYLEMRGRSCPVAGYLGLIVCDLSKTIRRDGQTGTVDLSKATSLWPLFIRLWRDPEQGIASNDDDRANVSNLRGRLAVLGIDITSARRGNMRLVESPD